LGSPENWNAAIRNAKGEWIKMMHDDDWFAGKKSLHYYADAALKNSQPQFIFSAFAEVDTDKGLKKKVVASNLYLALLKKSPLTLFKKNFIGHPSTTLVKNNTDYFYDKRFKWVVDIEFYMRYLKKHKDFVAIRLPLINIGINKEQITKQVFRKQTVEIPEVFGLYEKLPGGALKNIFCFDYYWRFIRNLSIRDEKVVEKYIPDVQIPIPLLNMIKEQQKFSLKTLQNGFVSKSLMIKSYILNYSKL
jgi:glycosyltransferase involved in cell wall biosynthesis